MRTRNWIPVLMAGALAAGAQTMELAPVVSRPVSRITELPGEILPYQSVAVQARIRGYVERVLVDRGSVVKQGEVLAELSAPEMQAQIAEAESRARAAEAERKRAEAQLAAAQSTAERLAKAAETPGAIAGNELIQARQQVEAARASVESRRQAAAAAENAARTQKELEGYLRITAPFEGVVTERLVHPGALVGSGMEQVLLRIEQISRLRVVVAVPEEIAGGIAAGARVEFRVAAYPERAYWGIVARLSHSLDSKTRTMAVELDAGNRDGSLSPGMYPSVKWPVRRSRPGLFVPAASVVTTTERTFVVRSRNGLAEWVDVRKRADEGDLVEVLGDLRPGDLVVRRATDEIREGVRLGPARE